MEKAIKPGKFLRRCPDASIVLCEVCLRPIRAEESYGWNGHKCFVCWSCIREKIKRD